MWHIRTNERLVRIANPGHDPRTGERLCPTLIGVAPASGELAATVPAPAHPEAA